MSEKIKIEVEVKIGPAVCVILGLDFSLTLT